ncbi:MAG: hypothetical protein ABIY50_07160 [Ignavibacteria bacterium]
MNKTLFTTLMILLNVTFARASDIPGLFSTGLDDNYNLLADGETDMHYQLISSSDKNFPGPESKVVLSNSYPLNVWVPNSSSSKWIAPRTDAGLYNEAGTYVYRITFDLSRFKAGTAFIAGLWTTDDNGLDILINGKRTGNFTPLGAFYGMFPFEIRNGFNDGINTIDFIVNNHIAPSGLRVEIMGKADPKDFVLSDLPDYK